MVTLGSYFQKNFREKGAFHFLIKKKPPRAILHHSKITFIPKTRLAISCAINFYRAGVATRDCRIGLQVRLCQFGNRIEFF
jgi:hypothetical protein